MQISPIGEHLMKVTLAGRLDTQGVAQVETRFAASLIPGGMSAIVDLSQVDFVASLGLRMLISAAQALRKRSAGLAVFGMPDHVRQVFESVALHRILSVCPTEEEALAAVAASS
jgi:anti-anti-sigma factor